MILQDFYEVSETTFKEGRHISKLLVNSEHPLYNGHFPGRPVTPGVVLMHLFKEEVQRLTVKKLRLVRAENVKFISVFDPSEENELELEFSLEDSGEYIKLKGLAKSKKSTILKISALYRII